MKRTELKSLPPMFASATLDASTLDTDARTVELRFYTGASVLRSSFFDGPYELSFEMSPKAAKLDRLNNGAPLIDSHNSYELAGMLGVVEKAWLAEDGARARVRFSRRPEVEPILQDVRDGVIRNVSMGTFILQMEDITEKGDAMKKYVATSWEPYELSLVPVPADAGAHVLSDGAESRPCTIVHREAAAADPQKERGMTKIKVRLLADTDLGKLGDVVEIDETTFDAKLHSKELAPAAEDPETLARKVDAAIAKDKARRAELQRLANHYGQDDLWVQRQMNLGATFDQALESLLAERSKRSPSLPNAIGFGTDYEASTVKLGIMADALIARSKAAEPTEATRPYRKMSLAEMALECLSWQGKGRGLDPRRDAALIFSQKLALHTTSDFPILLENVLNKMLLPEYGLASPSYRRIAAQKTFNDFRAHKFDRAGDFPNLLQVNEHGEFTYGSISESGESVTAATYGRIIGISRQAMINDDLGALNDMAAKAGRRFADFENALFYSTCIAPNSGTGPTLSDSVVVYHSTHANVGAGSTLANSHLEEAFGLLMLQTSLDGLKLNTMPRYLLVPPKSFALARRLLTSTTPADAADVNSFAGMIEAISDANLGTGTRWYVLADPAVLPNYVYGYVAGGGPRFEVRNGFEIDGAEFKAALDFACGAIDYRGGVTGTGA